MVVVKSSCQLLSYGMHVKAVQSAYEEERGKKSISKWKRRQKNHWARRKYLKSSLFWWRKANKENGMKKKEEEQSMRRISEKGKKEENNFSREEEWEEKKRKSDGAEEGENQNEKYGMKENIIFDWNLTSSLSEERYSPRSVLKATWEGRRMVLVSMYSHHSCLACILMCPALLLLSLCL